MNNPVLSIKNLSIALPAMADRKHAVENVSLTIKAGKTLCVVGESGSGKSMIAHSVMGLLPKTVRIATGAIELAGKDIVGMSQAQLEQLRGSQVGMIFQEPMTSLNPVMRVSDQIVESFEAHGMYGKGERRRRALALLEEVGLPDPPKIAKAFPHELSGGQRQRVMIAMALALEPKLLIADEPTTALDVTTQAQILRLIDQLRQKHGTAVLFITHDMGVVAQIADQIAVLEKGVLVEHRPAAELLSAPAHPYTQKLLAAIPSMTPRAPRNMTASPVVFSVKGLCKRYAKRSMFAPTREVVAADAISFELRKGETIGIVGESGSGKSTVGRCCMRLIEPDGGEILLDGRDISRLSRGEFRPQRKHIQIVFQDPFASLNPRHTIGRIISDGPVAHGADRSEALAQARELLDMVGLNANAIDRFPHEFSGGQRQRVGIARALALQPKVLIADEAVSALDVSVQAQVLKLIVELQQRLGLAILFVTHDLRVAAQICDQIIVMQKGRIVESGATAAVFANPSHPYTQQLLAAVPHGQTAAADEPRSVPQRLKAIA